MDVIAPRIRCESDTDGLPIVNLDDWGVEGQLIVYKPLGLMFEIQSRHYWGWRLTPTDIEAHLIHQCGSKPLPDMTIIRKLGKKAIQIFLIDTKNLRFARMPDPTVTEVSRKDEPEFDIEDDIPF